MKYHLYLTLILIFGSLCHGEDQKEAKLPKKIKELQALLQGKSKKEAHKETLLFLGKPERDIGSGLQIEQWDINGGILTFHQITGPTFRDAMGKTTWLMKTTNTIESNLKSSFEMTSRPEQDPKKIGMTYWLGNLKLEPSGNYTYQDSGQFIQYKKLFPRHFFAVHNTGKYTITYSKGIKGSDTLESLLDGSKICKITFLSEGASQSFDIITSQSSRSLSFKSQNQTFQMNRGWSSYWPKQNQP